MEKNIKEILSNSKTIAMVGVSKDLKKTSSIVMKYMQNFGYRVIPINPSAEGEIILGEKVYGNLQKIEISIDMVDVFRPSEEALGLAKDTIKIGARFFWLQLGIKNLEAKKLLEANKIEYIENKCTKIEYQKHFLNNRQHFPVLQE
tara:strand:- start:88 stop:525 length:438 start_codon:yes stop_codon:yes gene_type:complete